MSLSLRCRDSFQDGDVDRGDHYFRNDRAVLSNATDGRIHFNVFGSSASYEVELGLDAIDNGLVAAYCECPRYADGYFCKHLWAALRELDSRVDVPGERKLKLYFNDDPVLELKAREDAAFSPRKRNRNNNAQPWRKTFNTAKTLLQRHSEDHTSRLDQISGGRKQMWYVVQEEDVERSQNFVIRTYESVQKVDGEWGIPSRKSLSAADVEQYCNAQDNDILRRLKPASQSERPDRSGSSYYCDGFVVPPATIADVFPKIAATERFVWTVSTEQHLRNKRPLRWDGRRWTLHFRLAPSDDSPQHVQIYSELRHQDQTRPTEEVVVSYREGFVLFQSELVQVSTNDSHWLDALRRDEMLPVPIEELDDLLAMLTSLPNLPILEIDKRLKVQQSTAVPTGKVVIHHQERQKSALLVEPIIKYGDMEFELTDERTECWQAEERTLLRRDPHAEAEWLERLRNFAFEQILDHVTDEKLLSIPLKRFVPLTRQLVADGWEVVANGKPVRQATSFDVRIQSDSDWFDLRADAEFDGISATLPSLLAALKQRSQFVTLGDGSQGILPEAWLEKYAKLTDVAIPNNGTFRFEKSQALLLASLLAEQEDVQADRNFTDLCKKLNAFEGIKPGKEPRGFQGELRDYQRDGVGWLAFLREFGFGGCLADDMGLGKTIQVLAMLQGRRNRRLKKDEQRRPSIVIVPKSLVFNWLDEANRFTPKLQTLNYTGLDRTSRLEQFDESDLLITTYGTIRRDIEKLVDLRFDYVILDESQAVKNSQSQAAKAVRLVKADHRLAMTGTPVENHLGELWSLFDFLNPGMLGSGTAFKRIARPDAEGTEGLAWLSKAIRPFVLRRTKQQVLTELPEKTEQTLVCEMLPKQKKKYKELRDYYRAHLSKQVDKMGINRSKIHVLEALLRLRQAACDPRLLGEDEPAGAKVELLVEQLQGLLGDGHKALIFSQFTSLLAIVQEEFDAQGWTYEYLDGKTRDRAAKVERFQNDPDCPLFLISLKAGGSGLNLTAADYVFILDPWWNPAVEAQAVDRAHRIGQTKSVMAYRILCKDTVEDKIIQMQKSKRDLADAIITADKSLISELSLDDLHLLLE